MNFGFIGQGVGETSDSTADFRNLDPETEGGVGRISTVVSDTLASGEFSDVRIFSAFASEAGVKQLDSQLPSEDTGDVTVTIGIDHGNTSTEALEALRQSTAEAGVFVHENTTYHPKVYYFESEETFRVVVGSGNLTSRGLNTNVEAAFVFEGSVGSETHGDLQAFFDIIESEAAEITTALLSELTDTERVESERDTGNDDTQTTTSDRELDDKITADTPVGATYTPDREESSNSAESLDQLRPASHEELPPRSEMPSIPSGPVETTTDQNYYSQLQNDQSNQPALIRRYIRQHGTVAKEDLERVAEEVWGYSLSGSFGAAIHVLTHITDEVTREERGGSVHLVWVGE